MWRVRQTCAAVTFEAQQQLRQLGDVRRNPPRLSEKFSGAPLGMARAHLLLVNTAIGGIDLVACAGQNLADHGSGKRRTVIAGASRHEKKHQNSCDGPD